MTLGVTERLLKNTRKAWPRFPGMNCPSCLSYGSRTFGHGFYWGRAIRQARLRIALISKSSIEIASVSPHPPDIHAVTCFSIRLDRRSAGMAAITAKPIDHQKATLYAPAILFTPETVWLDIWCCTTVASMPDPNAPPIVCKILVVILAWGTCSLLSPI